jgi:uncharacterized membrane-anchored protein
MFSDQTAANAVLPFHPLRDRLIAEVHARPATPLSPPMTITRLATLSGPEGAQADRAHMTSLCDKLGVSPPGALVSWHAIDLGSWQLRWERHTEFSTWTFSCAAPQGIAENRNAIDMAPREWVSAMPGEALVATVVELHAQSERPKPVLAPGSVGSLVREGAVEIHSDFRPDSAGFTRFLALARIDDATILGRVVLALLEIETYRLMALFAFPLAGEAAAEIARLELEAAALADELVTDAPSENDRDLLERLAQIAAEAEGLRARTDFRFGAARAYHKLVEDRIEGLGECQVEGFQTLAEFMHRRLVPAMRTCDSTGERLSNVVDRIARTEQLLNTRVEVAAQATSLALLKSMNNRAEAQLKLQRTVEGLSVAAISYYAVGLIGFVIDAIHERFPGFDPLIAKGLVTIPIVLIVWLVLRRLRSTIAI